MHLLGASPTYLSRHRFDAIHSQLGNFIFPGREKNIPRQGKIARYPYSG
jgi:hypothetical protein